MPTSTEDEINTITQEISASLGHMQAYPPVFLTEREVAKVLRVQPKTLTTWRADGEEKLPAHQFGRLVRYRTRDVAEYLMKNKNQ